MTNLTPCPNPLAALGSDRAPWYPRAMKLRVLIPVLAAVVFAVVHFSDSPALAKQTMVGPGAYVFQTRVRGATCGDDTKSNLTRTFYASVEGYPGKDNFTMELLNSKYWPSWTLKVVGNKQVFIESVVEQKKSTRESRFTLDKKKKGVLRGFGYREYDTVIDGQKKRCRVDMEAILRPI